MTAQLQPGKLVTLRGREWGVLPSDDPDNLLIVKPLGGSDEEVTGIYLPLDIYADRPVDARFAPPTSADLGDISTARLLYDSARLAFRNGAGPFRALAKLSFRPRAYQIVPLIMALRQDTVRLLIADDVGVGKTIEALLIVRELLQRRTIKRFAVVCLPHLCEQWQEENQTCHRHQRPLPGRFAEHHRHHYTGLAPQPRSPHREKTRRRPTTTLRLHRIQ